MDELYNVGQTLGQEHAGAPQSFDPAAFADAMASDPQLAELLGGGGDIEQYLQNYEQMLAEGVGGGGIQLNKVDAEGGIHVRPDPGFVVKTRDTASGMKVFLNIVSNEHVESPHMKSFEELEGEQGCRVPLSVGTPVEDFDKKGEPCVTYDLVANPDVVDECNKTAEFRDTVIQLCISAVAQKYKVELDQRFKLPKIKYKGTTVQIQRLRKQNQSRIQEVGSQPAAPLPGQQTEERKNQGPPSPEFCIFYSLPQAPAIDGFSAKWGAPPEELSDVGDHLYGFDLPVYRVDEFQEKIRGTMKNKAARENQAEPRKDGEEEKPGVAETRQMLEGRTCVIQVRLDLLDPHVPSLKQFKVEVSDECMLLTFPPLPRSSKSMYSPVRIWFPQPFSSEQADSRWDPKKDMLVVTLPVDPPAAPAAVVEEVVEGPQLPAGPPNPDLD